MIWYYIAWHGKLWNANASNGMFWNGMVRHGMPWNFMVRHGMLWNGMEWHGIMCFAMVRHGLLWNAMVCYARVHAKLEMCSWPAWSKSGKGQWRHWGRERSEVRRFTTALKPSHRLPTRQRADLLPVLQTSIVIQQQGRKAPSLYHSKTVLIRLVCWRWWLRSELGKPIPLTGLMVGDSDTKYISRWRRLRGERRYVSIEWVSL